MNSSTPSVAAATWQELDDTLTTLGHQAACKAVKRIELVYPALQAILVMATIGGGVTATYAALNASDIHPVTRALPLAAVYVMLLGMLALAFTAVGRAGDRRIVARLEDTAKANHWRLGKAVDQVGGIGALPVSAVTAAPSNARTAGLLKHAGAQWLSQQPMTDQQLATAQQLASEGFTGTYAQLTAVARSLA